MRNDGGCTYLKKKEERFALNQEFGMSSFDNQQKAAGVHRIERE